MVNFISEGFGHNRSQHMKSLSAFHQSTARLQPTDEGQICNQEVLQVLPDREATKKAVCNLQSQPQGVFVLDRPCVG